VANGIDLLESQHAEIKRLLSAVTDSAGDERQQNFDELRRLLAVHETAEELVLRPITRKDVPGGDSIADARMEEENKSKEVLAKLEKLDVDSAEFESTYASFKADVLEHATHEEAEEFPAVRQHEDQESLGKLASRIEAAEKAAPTHPHPSARSTAANLVLGPFASIVDKVRDAISH
jgi:hemerythrin superfamily protein